MPCLAHIFVASTTSHSTLDKMTDLSSGRQQGNRATGQQKRMNSALLTSSDPQPTNAGAPDADSSAVSQWSPADRVFDVHWSVGASPSHE